MAGVTHPRTVGKRAVRILLECGLDNEFCPPQFGVNQIFVGLNLMRRYTSKTCKRNCSLQVGVRCNRTFLPKILMLRILLIVAG